MKNVIRKNAVKKQVTFLADRKMIDAVATMAAHFQVSKSEIIRSGIRLMMDYFDQEVREGVKNVGK